jgi:hypothetical protein
LQQLGDARFEVLTAVLLRNEVFEGAWRCVSSRRRFGDSQLSCGTSSPLSFPASPGTWRLYDPPKLLELLTHWHRFVSRKTRVSKLCRDVCVLPDVVGRLNEGGLNWHGKSRNTDTLVLEKLRRTRTLARWSVGRIVILKWPYRCVFLEVSRTRSDQIVNRWLCLVKLTVSTARSQWATPRCHLPHILRHQSAVCDVYTTFSRFLHFLLVNCFMFCWLNVSCFHSKAIRIMATLSQQEVTCPLCATNLQVSSHRALSSFRSVSLIRISFNIIPPPLPRMLPSPVWFLSMTLLSEPFSGSSLSVTCSVCGFAEAFLGPYVTPKSVHKAFDDMSFPLSCALFSVTPCS